MNLQDHLQQLSVAPQHRLRMRYDELVRCGMEIGFASELRDGRDYHMLTQEIAVSVQHFHDGQLTNTVFSNGHPIRLDLDDPEIIFYYSDYIELRYIVEGEVEVVFEDERERFHQGEFCLISSSAYHRESVPKSNGKIFNISVQRKFFTSVFLSKVNVAPLQQFLRSNLLKQSDHRNYLRFTPKNPEEDVAVQPWLCQILEEVTGRRAGYLDISRGYLTRLMDHFCIGYQDNLAQTKSDAFSQELFASVRQYLLENLQEVSMKDLTAEFHFQPNYFNNLIKKHTGLTYSDYLIELRMDRARYALRNTNASVEEIMWLVGYNNKGFFYRKFSEITGQSPSKYRAAHRAG